MTGASDWDVPAQRKRVRAGLAGSWEDIFHRTGTPAFLLALRTNAALRSMAASHRLERAIGVIYRSDTERPSHYFHTRLNRQFDTVVHVDETSALQPLNMGQHGKDREVPETFPSGM